MRLPLAQLLRPRPGARLQKNRASSCQPFPLSENPRGSHPVAHLLSWVQAQQQRWDNYLRGDKIILNRLSRSSSYVRRDIAPNGNKLTQTFADDVPINAEIVALITSQLAQMEQRLLLAIRKSQKPDVQCPFVRRKEAIQLLGTRSTLE